MESALEGLLGNLMRLAKDYRRAFVGAVPAEGRDDGSSSSSASGAGGDGLQEPLRRIIRVHYQDEGQKKRAMWRSRTRQIRSAFGDVHADATLVTTDRVRDTEETFRKLCQALQGTIGRAVELQDLCSSSNSNRFEENTVESSTRLADGELIDLAEAALAALVKLRADRGLLVGSSKTWIATQHDPLPPPTSMTSYWASLVRKIFNDNLEKKTAADFTSDDRNSEKENSDGLMVHEDPAFGVTQSLFATVMNAVAAPAGTLATSYSPQSPPPSQEQLESISQRMIALLDVMPSTWIPDTEVVKLVMETLCRLGTLESARLSHLTFQRHLHNHNRLRFSLVLQAYLEACKHEPVPVGGADKDHCTGNSDDSDFDPNNKVLLAVQEALEALHQEWQERLPRHRVERVVHCSLVLNCLCMAERRGVHVPHLFEHAENLVKRTMGGESFYFLKEHVIESDHDASIGSKPGGGLDARILPLVNCLIQVYCLGEKPQLDKARRLLKYMIQFDRQGMGFTQGRFMIQPMSETFNAILLSIVRDFEGRMKPTDEDLVESEKEIESTLYFADSLLDYMLSAKETSFWPNETTFGYLFSLLVATKPKDIGQRAEQVLSKMEILNAISICSDVRDDDNDNEDYSNNVKIVLSTHHRVLRCWMEAAKDTETTQYNKHCAERALAILEKLEMLSYPFLMNDREIQSSTVRNFYDIELRPSRKTYNLVQRICLDAIRHDVKAVEVAFAVFEKQAERRNVSTAEYQLLSECVGRLPEGSEERKAAEGRLQLLLNEAIGRGITMPRIALAIAEIGNDSDEFNALIE